MKQTTGPTLTSIGLEDFARRQGKDLAIITPGESMTYSELFEKVTLLSSVIVDRTAPTDWLPVVVDRSIDSVVALFAVLRSGRPLVPIECSQPASQIEEIFHLIGRPKFAVVAQQQYVNAVPPETKTIAPNSAGRSSQDAVPVEPDTPGLLLFTSGSTSRPKGVVIRWSGVDRWIRTRRDSAETIRQSMIRPLNFSGGFGQITQIAAGQTLCMVDPRTMNFGSLIEFFANSGMTHANLSPDHVSAMLKMDSRLPRIPTLREFSLQGIPCTWDDVARFRSNYSPAVTVVNGYSATETGRISLFRVAASDSLGTGPLPVGTLEKCERVRLVYAEDRHEVWVRDPDALEYLGNSELTAKRFVTDESGTRWWRSGDLARLDDEGNLYFLGRNDSMVKIRGMRVEPESTEHVLRSIHGIVSAAVVPHPTSNGQLRLVGHLCVDDESLTPTHVRSKLNELLPSHLVPAFFMKHESLPNTASQKLDRRALLSIPLERWKEPTDTRRFTLDALWLASKIEQIIGLDHVEPNDDIWEAGLDSMGAIELCSAIAAEGLGDVDPRVLVTERTAEEISHHLSAKQPVSNSPVVVFNPNGTRPPIFAVPGTTGTAFAYRSLSETLGSRQPIVVIEPRGMHCRGKIERTVSERAESIAREIRTRLDPGQQCLLISHSGGATHTFEAARILIAEHRSVHLLFLDGIPRDATTCNVPPLWQRRLDPGSTSITSVVDRMQRTITLPVRFTRKVWNLAANPIVLRFPGKSRYTYRHYQIFWRIDRRALSQHALRHLDVPATLLHVGNDALANMCQPWVGALESCQVRGDHMSMLYPPHVADIARHIERLLAQLAQANAHAMTPA